ncbi:MAG: AMP-binding protein [Thermodesulfobacteriota bacterium]
MAESGKTRSSTSPAGTLQPFLDGLSGNGERPAFLKFEREGRRAYSFARLAEEAVRVAAGLMHFGIRRGEPVALMGRPGMEWAAVCLGVMRAGAAVMPLDLQLDPETLSHILRDSGSRLFFCSRDRSECLMGNAPASHRAVYLLDAHAGEGTGWGQVLRDHQGRMPELEPEDRAALFYTSGTTGRPKGVPLSHRNLSFQLHALQKAGLLFEGDRLLLPLPLHHVYPLVMGMLVPLSMGVPIVLPFARTGPQLIRSIREGEATVVLGVPRLYSALYSGISRRFESGGTLSSALFRGAVNLSALLRRRTGILLGKRLLKPIHRRIGERLRLFASGGAALEPGLAWNLEGMGWQTVIGYGLTETSPLLTLKAPGDLHLESVGRPIPGVELRVGPAGIPGASTGGTRWGEVLARGPNVFEGYLNLPEETRKAFTDDGWFRTGDLGHLDEEGYLHLAGRISSILVTEGGENIQPEDVERVYEQHPLVREAGLLLQHGRPVLVVVPERSQIRTRDEPAVREEVHRAVQEQSARLASFQRPSELLIVDRPLARTRLGKIRRHLLAEAADRARRESGELRQFPAGPIPLEEMSDADRELLSGREVRQVWEWLCSRFRDRRLSPDSSPEIDLGIDSLEWLNITLEIRRITGVELGEEVVSGIRTVRDLLTAVAEAPSRGGAAGEDLSLAEPEGFLSRGQKRWLEPLTRAELLQAKVLFRLNEALIKPVLGLRVLGLENVPERGPYLITPNHVSYLDAFVLAAALGTERLGGLFWAGFAATAFANPLNRHVSRLALAFPVDPGRSPFSSLAFGAAVLKRGQNLVWFPEGERSPDGKLRRFKPGVGVLLEHYPVPVVPAFVHGTEAVLPVGGFIPRPGRVAVIFGSAVSVDELEREGRGKERKDRIVSGLEGRVAALAREAAALSGHGRLTKSLPSSRRRTPLPA